MRIRSLETFCNEFVGLVRLRTDSGAEGWGQLSNYHADLTAQVFHRQVAPYALGQPIDELDPLLDRILEIEFKFPGSYVRRALTGLDTAVWDLRGKLAGQSVCALLGGAPRPLPVYGSSMRRDITPAQEAARLADLQQAHGYTAFKFRIARECGHDQDEWPGRTAAVVPALRRALGDDTRLLVDANCGYSPARAIEVGRWLNDYGIVHFEEPCPYWEYEQTAAVTRALQPLAIQVAGGEQDCSVTQWRRLIETPAFDIVQPDIGYVGGLTRALRVAAMAQRAGLACVPHSANLTLITVFTLHMLGAIPNAGPYLEYSIEPNDYYPLQVGLYDPVLEVVDGRLAVPAGPGWGVEIRPDWLAQAQHQISALD